MRPESSNFRLETDARSAAQPWSYTSAVRPHDDMIRVSDIDILTADQMAAIDERQSRQQADWKAVPSHGELVKFLGIELIVLPGVFPPKDDTNLLAEHLCIPAGSTVLDVGTGTGALAIWAAQHGAGSVVATDISAMAVKNANQNLERLHLDNRVDVRLGHGLTTVASTERFDIIIANLPGRNKPAVDDTSTAQWDTNFQAHRALFEGAAGHLAPHGVIFMAKANYPDLLEMVGLAELHGFTVKVAGCSESQLDDPRKYYVIELRMAGNV
jgi:release factor glutamine methyltransferase